MDYRRVFIIRKDLNLSPGKLAAMVAHCAEAYWTRLISDSYENANSVIYKSGFAKFPISVDLCVLKDYIQGFFVKTICEARNKAQLMKAVEIAGQFALVENRDYGFIYDNCFTELIPEEPDGTTLVGIWFAPLPDEVALKISHKYQLYRA